MKISELVDRLRQVQERHGDLDIEISVAEKGLLWTRRHVAVPTAIATKENTVIIVGFKETDGRKR